MYLSQLKKEGIVHNPSRGIYKLGSSEKFKPIITPSLKKMYNKIHRDYPYVSCCIWNTSWINDLMRHQPFKTYTVIEVDKEAAEQIFNSFNDNSKNVYLNPDEEIFDRYISYADEVIIVKNLISEAPIEKADKISIPTLEKLLVDMLIEDQLFAAQQGEIDFIFKTALDKYPINRLKMKRYAMRRNRESKLENIFNIILAK
jgi:c-di-AMP phosphodiesterase-like protein